MKNVEQNKTIMVSSVSSWSYLLNGVVNYFLRHS